MKKKKLKALALALVAAQYCASAPAENPRLLTQPGWELGAHASRYKYEEPGFMSLDGPRGGVSSAFTIATRSRFFLRLDLRVSHGILDYDSSGTGTLQDVPDWLVEGRALYGRDLALGSRMTLSPYLGLGFRYLRNDLRGTTSTGAEGYVRASRYAYLPLGATLRLGLGGGWALAPALEYDVFLRGSQQSYLSDANPSLSNASNTQTRGRGYRAALMLETDEWSFGPWVQYWHIRDSLSVPVSPGLIGMEPENKTREAGIELRWRF